MNVLQFDWAMEVNDYKVKDLASQIHMLFIDRQFTVSFISLLLIMVSSDCRKKQYFHPQNSHQTLVTFYHEENIPFDSYWIVLEGEYQGENYTVAMGKMLEDYVTVGKIINQLNNSSTGTIELIMNQKSQESLQEIAQQETKYKLVLSSMSIVFSPNCSVYQTLYIRTDLDKNLLGKVVDKLQETILSSGGLKLSDIEKNTRNHYSTIKNTNKINTQLGYFEQERAIIDQEHLQKQISQKAKRYCRTLQMNLQQVLSYQKVNPEQVFNSTLNADQSTTAQQFQQYTFYHAYQQVLLQQQNYDYQNVFFEAKALCTGNSELKKVNKKKSSSEANYAYSSKVTSGFELQNEIERLKKSRKNRN